MKQDVNEVPLIRRKSIGYKVGVCSPFAAEATRGYLDGRETQDGRFVKAVACSIDDIQSEKWDAAIIFEGYFEALGGSVDAGVVILLPSGTAATLDALWSRSGSIRRRVKAKAEYNARLRHGSEVAAVQSLGEIENILPLVPHSPNTTARRIGKIICCRGAGRSVPSCCRRYLAASRLAERRVSDGRK